MKNQKICPFCGSSLPVSAFGKNARRPNGLTTYCKACTNIYNRRQRWAQRYEVLAHYGRGKVACGCCGETRFEFLSLHHIEGGGKRHMQEIGFRLVRWIIRNNYPPGFGVLCHNCNFALGHYGYCPHCSPSRIQGELDAYKSKFRGRGGIRHSALTEDQVAEIKRRLLKRESYASIAKDYPVGVDGIGHIKRGDSWLHVKPKEGPA